MVTFIKIKFSDSKEQKQHKKRTIDQKIQKIATQQIVCWWKTQKKLAKKAKKLLKLLRRKPGSPHHENIQAPPWEKPPSPFEQNQIDSEAMEMRKGGNIEPTLNPVLSFKISMQPLLVILYDILSLQLRLKMN